jgi:putative transposase
LIIKEQEAGEKTAEVCRRHALPGRALQIKVPRVWKRLRSLEDETGKPKELLTEQMLDNGREFTSMAIQKWVQDGIVKLTGGFLNRTKPYDKSQTIRGL